MSEIKVGSVVVHKRGKRRMTVRSIMWSCDFVVCDWHDDVGRPHQRGFKISKIYKCNEVWSVWQEYQFSKTLKS